MIGGKTFNHRSTPAAEEFLTHVGRAMQELKKHERVTQNELARRMQLHRANIETLFIGRDMRLSKVARFAHALGYRARVVFEHE